MIRRINAANRLSSSSNSRMAVISLPISFITWAVSASRVFLVQTGILNRHGNLGGKRRHELEVLRTEIVLARAFQHQGAHNTILGNQGDRQF